MWQQTLPSGTSLHDVILWDDGNGQDRKTKEALTYFHLTESTTKKYNGILQAFAGLTGARRYAAEMLGDGALTITAWIEVTDHGEGDSGAICNNGKAIFFVTDTDDKLSFSSDGNVTTALSANNSIVDGGKYFVAVTRNSAGDTTNLYINGVLSGTADQDSGTPANGTTALNIGNSNADDATFNGNIGPVIAFNKVLTANQIGQMYNKHKVGQ